MTADNWTIKHLLQWSIGYLSQKGLTDSPRLDAELLLAHALGVSRVYLYTHYDRALSESEREPFRNFLIRRGKGEPIAYILGTKEFLGHTFEVSPAVLIPRPDTELVVETASQLATTWVPSEIHSLEILDIGTGSGCIAIALALALPHAKVTAWDISDEALKIARRNAQELKVQDRVHFVKCDALSQEIWNQSQIKDTQTFHLIVSNPPYIAQSEAKGLSHSVIGYEPREALFAEEEGLIFYRSIASNAMKLLKSDGKLVLEIGSGQAAAVTNILANQGWLDTKVIRDLGRNDRCVVASHPLRTQKRQDSATSSDQVPEIQVVAEVKENLSAPQTSKSPVLHKRAGASVAGEPIYEAIKETHRTFSGASHGIYTKASLGTDDSRPSDLAQNVASSRDSDQVYVPLDAFGRPIRQGASRGGPIEYVEHALSKSEEELLQIYALEQASDLETEQ